MREGMEEQYMKEVIKKFPGSKWADLAAFHLIDNKLCGDWQGSSKCPVKEAEIYEKYVYEHPQSPAAAEALYDAAWRWSALIEIYKTEEEPKKSDEARAKAVALAQKAAAQIRVRAIGPRARQTPVVPDGTRRANLRKRDPVSTFTKFRSHPHKFSVILSFTGFGGKLHDYLLSVILGIIEGLTEFLPVSSTAHLRISEALLHISLTDGYWKMYTIVIQLGAILCLPVYFRERIAKFLSTFPRARTEIALR